MAHWEVRSMVTTVDRALNVRLPVDLYEALRKFAFDHRRSQAEVVREALQRFFSEVKPDE
jgi:predicted DNA-binding protein